MVDNLNSVLEKVMLDSSQSLINIEEGDKWGFPLKDLYRHGLHFYKDKSGKAVHLSYEDNLKLVAFTQQAAHGQIDVTNARPLGVLDVIGRDRRMAWQQLGSISKAQAMEGFIDLLDRLCPLFKPFIEAIKKDKEEKQRLEMEAEQKRREVCEQERVKAVELAKLEQQQNFEEIQRRQLQDALNQQTYHQFKAYAEKQYPGNPEQQAVLIKQLQTEHYHQYMQQLHAQVVIDNVERNHNNTNNSNNSEMNNDDRSDNNLLSGGINQQQQSDDNCTMDKERDSDNESGEFATVCPANMWTRSDIKLFKQEVSAGKGDGVIRVPHGNTVTVRVPTNEGGNCLFWEFATDNYDIGFGVYFEWSKVHTQEVSVHISESDEEDELDEDDDDIQSVDDVESGATSIDNTPLTSSSSMTKSRPLITTIIPVYRRECQNEVYAGSHNYPGEGVYLLKFDNSFSLWRSKTLYYRVYYTR